MRVIAMIDGEHTPAVVRDALGRLSQEHEVVAALFVGGEEKVPAAVLSDPVAHYAREVVVASSAPRDAIRRLADQADAVYDLSGDPVLDTHARLGLAAVALSHGLLYLAPGLRLSPPGVERIDTAVPIIAVIGTGKRTGKTALAGHLASLSRSHGSEPVIVTMGRGGPAEPQLVRRGERLDLARLREIAREGGHAASDYLEDAVLAGVTTVGTRRCAEGPAGEVYDSNVAEGVRLAISLQPDLIVLEGSGASLPPVEPDRTICVTRGEDAALFGLGPLRLMRADLVVLLGAPAQKEPIEEWSGAPLICCDLEPEPVEPVPFGARVAVFTTARPEHGERIRSALERQGIDVAVLSTNLGRRQELERDMEKATRERCDLFLTELKAAAIDTVAERAEREGAGVILIRNRVVAGPGESDLDRAILRLVESVAAPVKT